jgi:voltage-gated potassium channel
MLKKVRRALNDREFKALLLVVIIILLVGTLFYHHVERWGLLDSLYFCVTITTAGYGNLIPHTDIGKIFTMIYIFVDLGVVIALLSVVAKKTTKHYTKITEAYIKQTEEYFEDILEKTVRKIEK